MRRGLWPPRLPFVRDGQGRRKYSVCVGESGFQSMARSARSAAASREPSGVICAQASVDVPDDIRSRGLEPRSAVCACWIADRFRRRMHTSAQHRPPRAQRLELGSSPNSTSDAYLSPSQTENSSSMAAIACAAASLSSEATARRATSPLRANAAAGSSAHANEPEKCKAKARSDSAVALLGSLRRRSSSRRMASLKSSGVNR